ncbi:MAG: glycosyl hydrolase [Minisyncoccia bacterium]
MRTNIALVGSIISLVAIIASLFISFYLEAPSGDTFGRTSFILKQTTKCVGGVPFVTLTWNNPNRAKSFTLYRNPSLNGQNSWTFLSKGTASFRTYTEKNSYADKTYQYQVQARSGTGSSRYSNIVIIPVMNCSAAASNPAASTTASIAPVASTTSQTTPKPIVSTPPSVATSSSPAPTPPVHATSSTLQWGAFVGGGPAEIANFETLAGKQMHLVSVFTGWGANGAFPSEYGPAVRDKGKTMVLFWEQYGTTLDDIIAGKHDAYIKEFAASAQKYGGPIILAPLHEMNGDWDPWGGFVGTNSPEKVILAWKKIHDTFGAVPNVKFAWDVNNMSVPNTAANAIEKYYPGDAYVDYVAVDGFNFGSPWQTFDQVFAQSLAAVSKYNKPMYILSFASSDGSAKAAWITDALTVQMPKYPQLAGWVWFNVDKETDWRISSDAASLAAFKSAVSLLK